MHLHPLDPSVKCQHCGKGDLVVVGTWKSRDLYRRVADTPCESYTVHSRRDGRVCAVGAEVGTGLVRTWVECAGRKPAKGE